MAKKKEAPQTAPEQPAKAKSSAAKPKLSPVAKTGATDKPKRTPSGRQKETVFKPGAENPAAKRKGKKREWKAGSPEHVPTPASRAEVQALAAYGVIQEEIARYIGVCEKTLREHYREELDFGMMKANAKVANVLFQMATKGTHQFQPSTIFWLKARAGWTDKQQIDHTMKVVVVEDEDGPDSEA